MAQDERKGIEGLVQEPNEQVLARIVITHFADGRVLVDAPMNNRILCYGLLGLARDIIQKNASRSSLVKV